MGARVIDGERWIAERLRFLRERLADTDSDEEREAIETEIAALSEEAGRACSGVPLLRMPRRLRRGR